MFKIREHVAILHEYRINISFCYFILCTCRNCETLRLPVFIDYAGSTLTGEVDLQELSERQGLPVSRLKFYLEIGTDSKYTIWFATSLKLSCTQFDIGNVRDVHKLILNRLANVQITKSPTSRLHNIQLNTFVFSSNPVQVADNYPTGWKYTLNLI